MFSNKLLRDCNLIFDLFSENRTYVLKLDSIKY